VRSEPGCRSHHRVCRTTAHRGPRDLTTGPIACETGTLTTIYKAISGWESVTNATAGVPGVDEESRADFELRERKRSAAARPSV